jgi:hypothetical protein
MVQNGSVVLSTFCAMGTRDSPGVKQQQQREADHSPPTTAKVKNTRIYASTPLYAFMVQCLVQHKDKFSFYLHQHYEVSESFINIEWQTVKAHPQHMHRTDKIFSNADTIIDRHRPVKFGEMFGTVAACVAVCRCQCRSLCDVEYNRL